MKFKFEIDWYNGVVVHKDLLLDNKMWEQTFAESTFYNYYIGKYCQENKSTIRCYLDDKLIGVLILCHFKDHHVLKVKIKKKMLDFCSLGEVQLYVKPEYRKMGVATRLVEHLDLKLYDLIKHTHKENIVYVLQATQRAVDVASNNMFTFPVYDVFGESPIHLKELIKYNYVYNSYKIKKLSDWKHWKRLDKIA